MIAGAGVILTSAGAIGWNTSIWILHVAWTSLQHEDWVPRASVPRELYGGCIAFYELAFKIIWVFRKGPSGSRKKVTDSTTW